jgi:predicted O-methyltransferase YrrM
VNNVNKIKSTSDNFFVQNKNMYDFIYLDGNHKFDYVIKDCENAWKFLNIGGFLVCDDYIWNYYRDIKQNPCFAVNKFLEKNKQAKILLVSNSQIFLQKLNENFSA